jgi:hypothetical protein
VRFNAGTYRNGDIRLPRVDAIAARDQDGALWLALTNIDPNQEARIDLGAAFTSATGEVLTAPAVNTINTFDAPDAVSPAPYAAEAVGGRLELVLPSTQTLQNGSMCSSSVTIGDWEGFITHDLVGYIDAHYRTIPNRASRGLFGHSMGGYGVSRLGMKYPGIFAALYIMGPCCMSARGAPEHVRSDNGREIAATAVREWIAGVGSMTAFIEPGSPWENGYVESFNRKLHDEVLNGEIYYTLREAQVLIEAERRHFNTCRNWSFWRGVSGRKHLRPNVRLAVASGQSPQL